MRFAIRRQAKDGKRRRRPTSSALPRIVSHYLQGHAHRFRFTP